jgi:hypothetical protein
LGADIFVDLCVVLQWGVRCLLGMGGEVRERVVRFWVSGVGKFCESISLFVRESYGVRDELTFEVFECSRIQLLVRLRCV